MEEFKLQNIPVEIKKQGDKYTQLLEKVKEIYGNFVLDSSDMENIFNEKYKNSGVVQLLDAQGGSLIGMDGKRIEPVEFEKIDSINKQNHIRGLLYKLTLNSVDFVDKLSQETDLLRVLKVNGVDLERMIYEYRQENQR